MRTLYDVPAPAKLNLFLHITGRRSDGYHLLQSVFMLIDWQDQLHFERTASPTISRSDLASTTALPADDLCVRAARALQAATGCTQGAHIGLEKSIPAQAGMGGGSSNAATTLLALNRLWQLHCARAGKRARRPPASSQCAPGQRGSSCSNPRRDWTQEKFFRAHRCNAPQNWLQ